MTAGMSTTRSRLVLDPFAGPGGWSEGLKALGRADVGIELDRSACATRAAAGHPTIRADVASFPLDHLVGRVEGLIASPPCQTFSKAGTGAGREALPELCSFVYSLRDGWREPVGVAWDPERTGLVLQPIRWAWATRPDWVALEQVPDVLPVWEVTALVLEAWGYQTWTGVLNAANYGVPQTRQRAFLLAHRHRKVQAPAPTHARHPRESLLGPALLPWVSMAEALGWTGTVSFNNTINGGPIAERFTTEPAVTVGSRSDLWKLHTNRDQRPDGTRQTRETTAPAPALTAKAGGQWAFERPATTVCADPRLGRPGHKDRDGGESQFQEDALRLTVEDALRLTVEDALRLQSFRADYPVRGTKTKQFEQIGNAVPPLLAQRVLEAVAA